METPTTKTDHSTEFYAEIIRLILRLDDRAKMASLDLGSLRTKLQPLSISVPVDTGKDKDKATTDLTPETSIHAVHSQIVAVLAQIEQKLESHCRAIQQTECELRIPDVEVVYQCLKSVTEQVFNKVKDDHEYAMKDEDKGGSMMAMVRR